MIMSSIKNGSSIDISYDIDKISEEFFGVKMPSKILIVEGDSDKIAIERLYYINSRKLNFEIRLPSRYNDSNMNGKRKALEVFENEKSDEIELKFLLDRDYDFILKNEVIDRNIFYYDYFELENYLFDDFIFRRYVDKVLEDFNPDHINLIHSNLKKAEITAAFTTVYKMTLFREIDYHEEHKIESLTNPHQYAKILKEIKFAGIIDGLNPQAEGEDIESRFCNYLKYHISEINPTLYDDIKLFFDNKNYEIPTDFIEFCKYYYKGKNIMPFINTLINNVAPGLINRSIDSKKFLFDTLVHESTSFCAKIYAIENSFSNNL